MSLPLAEKIWVVRPEAPFDDDRPTGRYFCTLHKVVEFDFDGSVIWSEDRHTLERVLRHRRS